MLLSIYRVALFQFAIICFSPVASGSCFCTRSLNPLRPATQLFLCSLLCRHLSHTWILELSCECHFKIINKIFCTQHQCRKMEQSCSMRIKQTYTITYTNISKKISFDEIKYPPFKGLPAQLLMLIFMIRYNLSII